MAPRESFEAFDGCKIKVMRSGEGAPLLLLHGAGGAGMWLPYMEKLAQHFALIVPEHPGFGASDTPEWLDCVGDLAYFYLDVIERLGLSDVTLVGNSLGGWIAAEIAVRNCTRLRALVLSAAAGIHVKGVPKGDLFLWSPEQTQRNMFHDQKLAEAALAQPLSEEQLFAAMKNRLTLAKLAWQPRLYNRDLHKWLHRISVPTLLLWGDRDKVIPSAYGPAYQRLIPGAKLHVFKDCGHLPQMERTDDYVGEIVAFAKEVGA
jgi:pimeloyl-ACP methyl ester carboxylesterase